MTYVCRSGHLITILAFFCKPNLIPTRGEDGKQEFSIQIWNLYSIPSKISFKTIRVLQIPVKTLEGLQKPCEIPVKSQAFM